MRLIALSFKTSEPFKFFISFRSGQDGPGGQWWLWQCKSA